MSEIEAETIVEGSNKESFPKKEESKAENEDSANENDDSGDKEDEPVIKKAKIVKDNAVNDTKAAKDVGKDSVDEHRSTTRGVRDSKASTKRVSTMHKTAKEGEALLKEMGHKDENPGSDRRKTRSQTRGTPPASAQKTKQDTAKRSRRGRPRKEEKVEKEEPEKETEKEEEEEEEETKSEDMNNAEEKKETPQENSEDAAEDDEEESQPETDNDPADKAD